MPTILSIICKSFAQEEKEIKQRLKYEKGRSSRMLRSEKQDIKNLIGGARQSLDVLTVETS